MSENIEKFFDHILAKLPTKPRKPLIDFNIVEEAVEDNDFEFMEELLKNISKRRVSYTKTNCTTRYKA